MDFRVVLDLLVVLDPQDQLEHQVINFTYIKLFNINIIITYLKYNNILRHEWN